MEEPKPLMKQVHFDLHYELFERLKVVAVKHNVTLRVLLTRMVYRYLKELEDLSKSK